MTTEVLFVRVEPADKEHVAKAAKYAELSVSDLVRKASLAAADALLYGDAE